MSYNPTPVAIEDILYLQSANVIKLQQAARLSGLRWKSGAPGYDKAGIIQKLANSPSILRATVANLKRMEGGAVEAPVARPSILDDILEDMNEVQQGPVSPAPPRPDVYVLEPGEWFPLASGKTLQNLMNTQDQEINRAHSRITSTVDDYRILARAVEKAQTTISTLQAEVAALQVKQPVQFTVDNVSLPIVSGEHFRFNELVFWASLKNHILLIGPASSGKTTAAIKYADMMGLELYSQPLTMDAFGVLGFVGPQGRVDTEFSRAWCNGGVFLWDELSMSAKEAIGCLNAALANGFASFPGLGTIKKHADFRMIAGDNSDTGASMKYGARELLDGASLDRFIRLDWPIDPDIEAKLGASAPAWLACVRAIRAEIDRRDIQHVGATMRAVIQGAQALSQQACRDGLITRQMILEATCKKGALAAEWAGILNLPAVKAFLQGA